MEYVTWRVEALATPLWHSPCAACHGLSQHVSTGLFRVNANGARHDVWLLYRCAGCGATHKRRVEQRVRAHALPADRFARYLANDPALALEHAFELATREPLPYRVLRPPLDYGASLHARIEQPFACGVRWDRMLAREFGCSRNEVARAFARGAIALPGVRSLARPLRDGEQLILTAQHRGLTPLLRPSGTESR